MVESGVELAEEDVINSEGKAGENEEAAGHYALEKTASAQRLRETCIRHAQCERARPKTHYRVVHLRIEGSRRRIGLDQASLNKWRCCYLRRHMGLDLGFRIRDMLMDMLIDYFPFNNLTIFARVY